MIGVSRFVLYTIYYILFHSGLLFVITFTCLHNRSRITIGRVYGVVIDLKRFIYKFYSASHFSISIGKSEAGMVLHFSGYQVE